MYIFCPIRTILNAPNRSLKFSYKDRKRKREKNYTGENNSGKLTPVA